MSLSDSYGRDVPGSVRLSDMFDAAYACESKVGDLVEVVDPPEDTVEIDDSSLWAKLKYTEGQRDIRLYEHEYEQG